MTLERDSEIVEVIGESLGAGRVRLTRIDGFPVDVSGALWTIVLVARDQPGSVARICGILADEGVNLATMRVTRKERGGDAFMVLELDDPPSNRALSQIRKLDWVRMVRALEKVAA
jgi:L-serine dehydratase